MQLLLEPLPDPLPFLTTWWGEAERCVLDEEDTLVLRLRRPVTSGVLVRIVAFARAEQANSPLASEGGLVRIDDRIQFQDKEGQGVPLLPEIMSDEENLRRWHERFFRDLRGAVNKAELPHAIGEFDLERLCIGPGPMHRGP